MSLSRRSFLQVPGLALLGAAATACERAASVGEPPRSPGAAEKADRGFPPAARGMKILVLGGTAFLGPEVVAPALARGHQITLFNRGKTNPQLFPEVEKLHGDRDGDLSALAGRTWDAVVDTSGYVPRIVGKSAAALQSSGQYVFISTISVYDAAHQTAIDEQSPVHKLDDPTVEKVGPETYGGLKALCEKAAEKEMPGRVTVIRPGLIAGPGDPSDRFTYWPVRAARGGEAAAPGSPSDPVQFIDVRDLGAWIVTMIERRRFGVWSAVGPRDPLTMGGLLDACRRAAGSDVRYTWVDAAFLEKSDVSPWSDMPVWLPPSSDDAAALRISNARAVRDGLTFRPAEDTARDTLAWFRAQREARTAQLKAGLSPEREATLLAAWNQRPR